MRWGNCGRSRHELQLSESGLQHPIASEVIARGQAERLEDMGLGLLTAPQIILGVADEGMSGGQILIQHQRLLKFGNTLQRAVRRDSKDAQHPVG